ncbi:MAG TPA: GxxExxY protein [Steroidobacteraceae bacterium]|jgi:GxxExxY protein
MEENEIGRVILGGAIQVHRELGPGLLESVYETVLLHELQQRGLQVERQVPIDIEYRGMIFKAGFRADLLVEAKIIVELKCIGSMSDVHKKQLLTYLRLTGMKLGYLLNFGEVLLRNGIVRIVNRL